jgi:hypothetical protein
MTLLPGTGQVQGILLPFPQAVTHMPSQLRPPIDEDLDRLAERVQRLAIPELGQEAGGRVPAARAVLLPGSARAVARRPDVPGNHSPQKLPAQELAALKARVVRERIPQLLQRVHNAALPLPSHREPQPEARVVGQLPGAHHVSGRDTGVSHREGDIGRESEGGR